MVGWNALPKELKWLIFKHLIYECYLQRYTYTISKKTMDKCKYNTKLYCSYEKKTIELRELFMYELLTLLSLIDKQRFVIVGLV